MHLHCVPVYGCRWDEQRLCARMRTHCHPCHSCLLHQRLLLPQPLFNLFIHFVLSCPFPPPAVFQQLEVDYCIQRPRPDVWAGYAQNAKDAPVVRLYGVNDAGERRLCIPVAGLLPCLDADAVPLAD
jgi:hypothetical protein